MLLHTIDRNARNLAYHVERPDLRLRLQGPLMTRATDVVLHQENELPNREEVRGFLRFSPRPTAILIRPLRVDCLVDFSSCCQFRCLLSFLE